MRVLQRHRCRDGRGEIDAQERHHEALARTAAADEPSLAERPRGQHWRPVHSRQIAASASVNGNANSADRNANQDCNVERSRNAGPNISAWRIASMIVNLSRIAGPLASNDVGQRTRLRRRSFRLHAKLAQHQAHRVGQTAERPRLMIGSVARGHLLVKQLKPQHPHSAGSASVART